MTEHRTPRARRALGRARRHRRRLGRRRPRAALDHVRTAGADPGVRGVRARAGRRRAGARPGPLQHRPGGRRGRLGARAHRRGQGQRLAPRAPPVPRQGAGVRGAQGLRPRRGRAAGRAHGPAAHAGRDLRARPRLRQRPRRLDAPAVEGSRRDGHQRHRRRRRPAGGGLRLVGPAGRHLRGLGHLLRRRRREHRVDAGELQPRRGLAAAGLLLRREQPVRGVHHASPRRPASRGCPPAAPASASPAGGSTAWTRWRCTWRCARRSSTCAAGNGPTLVEADDLPVLPPERALPRQRLPLPQQGGGGGLAGARPGPPDRRPAGPPRAAHPGAGRAGGGRAPSSSWPRSATSCWSRCRAASPASAGSGRPSGPTRPSWTSASAATCREFDGARYGDDSVATDRHAVHRRGRPR